MGEAINKLPTIKILVVEDDPADFRLLAKQLRDPNRELIIDWADCLAKANEKLDRISFDVILTDLWLPESAGLMTVSKLRARARDLPIIVLTSLEDEHVEHEIMEAGAQDYLVKGEWNGRAILRTIVHAIRRQQMRNEVKSLLIEREQSQQLLHRQADLLRRKNRRMRRLCRTAQEFVENVSHDFRTPLTVIKDFVNIIREGMVGAINPEQQKMLDKVAVRADDLNNMVDDLLDVSTLQNGMVGACRRAAPVRDIMERAESMLRQRAQVNNIQLTIDSETDLPEVYCVPDLVGRVITNLTVNAIKFSPVGSTVRLWAQHDPAAQQVVIGVTDNGPGIDEELLGKIFERFKSRVKTTVKGFGLGLNIARQLCHINLGELSVQSRIGVGSTFSFTIPVADPSVVLARWLNAQNSRHGTLQLIQVSTPGDIRPVNAEEFDHFLNCLLRKPDILFRVSPTQWFLMMADPDSDWQRWRQRAAEEFTRHNRNRPMGPLPDYRAEIRGQWPANTRHASIVDDFITILRPRHETLITG